MKLLTTALIVLVLQVLGCVSALAVRQIVFPGFQTEYAERLRFEREQGWHSGTLSERMLMNYVTVQAIVYLPFLFASLLFLAPFLWKYSIPKVGTKMRRLISVTALLLGTFLLTGVSYGFVVPEANPPWAFAVVCFIYGAGLFGLYCMYDARHRNHPTVQIIAGAVTLMLAYASLEILLLTGFGK